MLDKADSGDSRCMNHPVTKTVVLNQGSAEEKRREILHYFHTTFDQYALLFDTLNGKDAWFKKAIPLRHPLIFYFAHTAVFYINKLKTAGLISRRLDPDLEAMMAIGVDEMSWDDLNDTHYQWPSIEHIQGYRAQVRECVSRVIKSIPINLPVQWESPCWVIMMGIEHERIHLETSSVLIRQLPITHVKPHPDWPVCKEKGNAPDNRLIPIAGRTICLGKSHDEGLYGWDNEYGQFDIDVPDFLSSQYLVTHAEYKQFVDAGGYENEQWWSKEGWAWQQFRRRPYPEFWVPEGQGYRYRCMLEEIPMPWNWPVDANCHEAQAFCRWKSAETGRSIQLPSEAQWYCLRQLMQTDQPWWRQAPGNINLEYWASSCPVDLFSTGDFFDVIGNVWQWTSTAMDSFKGFKVHPYYDDFSTPTFDGQHHLIKGGSWISTGNCATRDSRYAFRRHFFQHAGFRYVESTASEPAMHNPYETDQLVGQYLHFHYGEPLFLAPNFPATCAELCQKLQSDSVHGAQQTVRVMDIGCSVGRTSLELARWFHRVDAVDFSARFIAAASELQKNGKIRYFITTEGELGDYCEASLAELGLSDIDLQRVHFSQGDACNLKAHHKDYDLVFAGNLIDRLSDPASFLGTIHERLNPCGLLVITSPYTWLEDYTPKDRWIGGIRENGEAVTSYQGLARLLAPHFEQAQAPVDIPFVIRETARKHQHTIAQCTFWRKKAD